MATAFSTLARQVLSDVPGVPMPLVITKIRLAVTELCRDAGVWIEDLTAIDSVALQDEYTLVSNDSTNGKVRTINDVTYSNQPLRMKRIDWLRKEYPDHPNTATPSTPNVWAAVRRNVLTLHPIPETAVTGAIEVRATIVPQDGATAADDDVMEDYEEQIMRGTLHRLLSMPDKSWTDMKLADFHGRRFRNDIAMARAAVLKGYSNSSLAVATPKVTPLSVSIRRAI